MIRRLLLAASLMAAVPLAAEQHPSLANGFDQNKVYQLNGIDSVNVFSGNLIVTVPIGPTYTVNGSLSYRFGLYYNGNCWRFRQTDIDMTAFPEPRMNAGLGWQLTLGELIAPDDPFEGSAITSSTTDAHHWIYRGPDGADHIIDALPDGRDPDPGQAFGYNKEAPFLRLRRGNGITSVSGNLSASSYTVEFPDGTKHIFQSEPYDSNQQASYSAEKKLRYLLARIEDVHGNYIRIDYFDSTPSAPAKWVVHEGNGATQYPRQHTVTLADAPVDLNQRDLADIYGRVKRNVVASVALEDNGTSRKYLFDIVWRDIPRLPEDDTLWDGAAGKWITGYLNIGLLDDITLPDGSKFAFKYSETPNPEDYVLGRITSKTSGHMTDLYLPTGGHIQYTIRARQLPAPYPEGPLRRTGMAREPISVGWPIAIVQRTAFDTKGNAVSITRSREKLSDLWTKDPNYAARPRQEGVLIETGSASRASSGETPPVMDTVLDRTVHYFNVAEGEAGFGLEFTKAAGSAYPGDAALLLGSETLKIEPCPNGDWVPAWNAVKYEPPHCGSTPATILRRTYNTWTDGGSRASAWTMPRTRTVFDSCAVVSCTTIPGLDFVDTTRTDDDGYGHFRTQTTTSTLGTGTASVVRTSVTNYHPGRNRSDNPFASAEPWLLDTYTYQETIEGAKKLHTETTFDAYGELTKAVTYAGTSGQPQTNDAIAAYKYDAFGNRTEEAYSGGDGVSSCDPAAATSYTIRNEYTTALLSKSQYSGVDPSFYTVNRTIDNAGIVTASTDSAGVRTTYSYDSLLRLTGITPAGSAGGSVGHSAATRITYNKFSNTAPASVVVDQPGFTNGTEKYIYYDWMGRVELVKTRLPGSPARYSATGTVYDAMGRAAVVTMPTETSSSGYESFATWPATHYTYDDLGRIVSTTQPDGTSSTTEYPTASTVRRTVAIGDGVTGTPTKQVTTETHDALDRLTAIDENVSGTSIQTQYTYTPGDQLATVVMKARPADGSAVQTQTRTFTYDGRGFLTAESIPEKTDAVKYTAYDARGHLRQKSDNGTVLNYDYDAAERLTKVCDASHVLLAGYQYDSLASFSPNPASLGKLVASTRHNRGTPAGADVPVTEFFRYGGLDGLISEKATCIDFSGSGCQPPDVAPAASQHLFRTSYAYDDAGRRNATTVGECASCIPAVASRQWTTTYTNGLLTAVALAAPASRSIATINYSEAGLVSSVVHTDSGTDTIVPDPRHMPRPGQIKFDGWAAETCNPAIDQTGLTDPAPIALNGTATLSVAVLPGSGTVWYQWYDTTNGRVPVAGATSSSFTTGPVTATRRYAVAVTNSCGSVASREVTVRLASCATVSLRSPQKAEASKPFTITGGITGDSINVATWQWYRGPAGDTRNPIAGATTSTLTVVAPAVDATDEYWVAITGTGSCPASKSGTLALTGVRTCGPPVITALDAEDHRDGSFTLRLSMDCVGESYTWTGNVLKAGSTETTLVPMTAADDTFQRTVRPITPTVYTVLAENAAGSARRSVAVWPVCRTYTITSDLSDQRIARNSSAHLSVALAAGTVAASFDWYEGRAGDLGSSYLATTSVPEFDTPPIEHDTTFWVRIHAPASQRGSYCEVDSRTAQVSVCNPPAIVMHPSAVTVTCDKYARTVIGAMATGDGLQYQWYAGDTAGDMTRSTALPWGRDPNVAVFPDATTSYWLRVTGECGVADSQLATVRVLVRPDVTLHAPEWQMALEGEPVTVSAESRTAGATFRWAEVIYVPVGLGWAEAPPPAVYLGQTQVYNLPAGTHLIRLSVYPSDNQCPTEKEFTIDVCHPPQFTSTLTDRYIDSGTFTDLVPTTDTAGAFVYWYLSDPRVGAPPIINAGNAIHVSPATTTTYWYRAFAGCYSVVRSVTVHVCTPASLTITAPQTIVEGTSATLTAAATDGVPPIAYIWYTGDARGPITEIGRNTSSMAVSPVIDTTYWVEAYGNCPAQSLPARQKVTIAVCHPPQFTLTPQAARTLAAGENLVLSAAATGTAAHLSWFKGAAGDRSNPQTVTSLIASDSTAGTYWVEAAGDCGTISAQTVITVCHPPALTAQSGSTQVTSGGTTTLSVAATGTALTYSWKRINADQTETQVGTAPTYTTDPLTQATQYYALVTSQGYCTARSATVTVSVCSPPQFTATPADVYVNNGPVNLSAQVDDPNATLTWYASDPRLGPATAVTLPVNPTAPSTTYWVQARDGVCVSTVSSQTVFVCTPSFTSVTPSQTITEGTPVTLQAAAAGPSMTYKWWTGTTAPATQIASTSSVTVSPATDTNYWAEAKCNCPITTVPLRQQVTITVCHPAVITAAPPPAQNVTVGDWVSLSSTTAGTNVQVHWYKGAAGDKSAPVTVSGGGFYATPGDSGTFWVEAAGNCGTATAQTVVDVCVPPVITTQPVGTQVQSGDSANLSVAATGTSLTYAWIRVNSDNTETTVGAAASFNTGALTTATTYYVRIYSRSRCYVNSVRVTVSVCTVPAITWVTPSQTIGYQQPVQLYVSASGSSMSYEWKNLSTSQVIATAYSVNVAPTVTTSYSVRVYSGICSVTSATVTLTICGPTITQQPASTTIQYGSTATLSIAAVGDGAITTQWYRGAQGDTSTPIGTGLTITVQPYVATSYWVRVSTACRSLDSTAAVVNISGCTQPVIQSQSAGMTVVSDQNATMSVTPSTTADMHYQWYVWNSSTSAWQQVAGATSATYTEAPTTISATYMASIWNSCGLSVNSSSIAITRTPACYAAAIATQPASVTYSSGQSVTFSVAASGTNVRYQWYGADPTGGSFIALTGRTASTLTVAPQSASASYYAVATANCGASAVSNTVTATRTCTAPAASSQTQSQTIRKNAWVNLSFTATGTAAISYTWYSSATGSNFTQLGTGATYSVQPQATTYYYASASNACGSVTSSYITITVSQCAPAISTHPASQTISSTQSVTLSVAATSDQLQYQWYVSTGGAYTAVSGATAATLTYSPSGTSYFYANVYNDCGSVNSNTATVTVTPACVAPGVSLAGPVGGQFDVDGNATITASFTGSNPTLTYYRTPPDGTNPVVVGGPGTATQAAVQYNYSWTYWYYYVVASNGCGTATSNAVLIAQYNPNAMLLGPASSAVQWAGSTSAGRVSPLQLAWSSGSPVAGPPPSSARGDGSPPAAEAPPTDALNQ